MLLIGDKTYCIALKVKHPQWHCSTATKYEISPSLRISCDYRLVAQRYPAHVMTALVSRVGRRDSLTRNQPRARCAQNMIRAVIPGVFTIFFSRSQTKSYHENTAITYIEYKLSVHTRSTRKNAIFRNACYWLTSNAYMRYLAPISALCHQSSRWSLLHFSCSRGYLDITWMLLEAGANPLNAVDKVIDAVIHAHLDGCEL